MAKKKYKAPMCYSNDSDTGFFQMYRDMVQSPAYLDLSTNAKIMYMCMRCEIGTKGNRSLVSKEYQCEDHKFAFVFPRNAMISKYGLSKDPNGFELTIHELIQHGFISVLENGRLTRTASVYEPDCKWIHWTVGTDYRSAEMIEKDIAMRGKRNRLHTLKR